MKCIKLNNHICINKEINMHKLTRFFSPSCINKILPPFLHKTKHTYMHKQGKKHAYINSKSFSPFLSNRQQRGENKSNNKDICAIYIHEEERRKVNSLCIHVLHEKEMTKP